MALGHQRSLISIEMVDGWFNRLKYFLKKEVPDSESLLQDPTRIFNADESVFPLSITNGKVLTERVFDMSIKCAPVIKAKLQWLYASMQSEIMCHI